MLTYLPKPYDDELIYSIVARTVSHVGLRGRRIEQMFGRRCVRAQVDLPSYLGRFARNSATIWGFTAEEIAEKYTLLPFYTYYANETLKKKVMKTIKSDSGLGLHISLGITTSNVVVPKFLRYCPECVSDDIKRWGETYWRRTHQLPGVLVCTCHREWLASSEAPYRPIGLWDFSDATDATRSPNYSHPELSNACMSNALKIAQRCEYILHRKESAWGLEDRKDKYRVAAIKAGFAKSRSNINSRPLNQAKLEDSFIDFFGRDFLTAIGCDVIVGSEHNWLRKVFHTRGEKSHPVQHALLEIFFEELPVTCTLVSPFGVGPWKCPNRHCNQETHKPIRSIEIRLGRDDGKPYASASCPCGFRFSFRTVVDGEPIVDRIIRHGAACAEKAKALIGSGLSRVEASKILQVYRRSLDEFINGKTEAGKHDSKQEKVLIWRKEWKSLLEQVPNRNRTEAKKLNPTLYNRLRRNDPEWLYTEFPRYIVSKQKVSRINWDVKDRSLVERIRSAARELREVVPLRRVSRTRILKHAGISLFAWKKKDSLPLFTAAVDELEESVENFHERRRKKIAAVGSSAE